MLFGHVTQREGPEYPQLNHVARLSFLEIYSIQPSQTPRGFIIQQVLK
jgi:hypothetical protein